MTACAELPPFRVIASALRATTERLVREVVDPQQRKPDWNEFEWAVARAASAMQGISGLLANRLKWRGPASWHAFLEDQRAHLLVRHAQIGKLLTQLDRMLRDAGIPFVPLKGSALRDLGLHQPGERPQSDIDLLLAPADVAACGALLETMDYHWHYSTRRHAVYGPAQRAEAPHFGEHAGNPVKFELHTRIAEALPLEPVDITASIPPGRPAAGTNSYRSLAALMRHMSLHAAGNMRANAMRFIQIYDVAQLAGRMTRADWQELLGENAARVQPWWLFPPLALAARYVPASVPAPMLARVRAICPRRLRDVYEHVSVYEVSWSNLRIPALPGREWSRSPGETLRFARSRVWPSRAALDDLAVAAVAEPQLMQVRWYGASHLERIVRWLFTHPPRVQTLSVVSAALQAEGP